MAKALDILVEDLQGSLWVAAIHKNKISALEIDPYVEMIRWGSIYWAKVMKVDAKLNAAFLDLGHDLVGMLPATEIPGMQKDSKIGRKLRAGQFVMVQVKTARQPQINEDNKDERPVENKASKVSMDIALQGRFLIYTPRSPGTRISRRIRDPKMRKQIHSMVKNARDVKDCILRASAAYTQTDMLIREARILRAIWESLQAFTKDKEPALLMMGPDALQRVLSDFATTRIGEIHVATDERREEADNWCDLYAPELMQKLESRQVENTRTGMGLMEARDILGEIETLIRPYIILSSGGSVIMQETALGMTIDVNSGGADIAGVNAEAADEIARQIRLRNIGGAILIDFAGIKDKSVQKRLGDKLREAFEEDPCTVEVHGVSHLGLFEISRHRRTPSLIERIELMQDD